MENFLKLKIVTLYTNNRGEFIALRSSMPLFYWPFAMNTSTYLIKRLPKVDLSM